MYTNILYFITVLLIFSLYNPPGQAIFPWYEDAVSMAVLGFLFYFYNRKRCAAFVRTCEHDSSRITTSATTHAQLIHRSTILAIILYTAWIYVFDLKLLIMQIPLSTASTFVSNLLGIAPFFCLLIMVWYCSFPSYRQLYHPGISLRSYVLSHIQLNSAIVIPWLLVSLVLDVMNFLSADIYTAVDRYPLAGIAFIAALLVLTGIYFPYVMIKLWGCVPLPDGALRRRLEDFCRKSGFTYSDIMVWNLFDGRLITAGVVGFAKKFRYVLISPALLRMLDDDEIESVIAHEIGHVKNHHMIYYVVFLIGYLSLGYGVSEFISYELLSRDFFINVIVSGEEYANTIISIVLTALPLIFFLIYFRFIFGFFSRNFERQSDLHALKLTGSGAGIITSLGKIARLSSQNANDPNWHHFGIGERIRFMESCLKNPALIQKHDARVSVMVSIYVAILIVLSLLSYGQNSETLSRSRVSFMEKVLEKQIEKHPENPLYHFALGNVYYEQGELKKAERFYKTALYFKPDDPEVLNNLAWLYATAKQDNMRKPVEALVLAREAARIDPRPHILDTLGESCFINGLYKEAVAALEQAVAKNPDNVAYYKGQLEKFKTYLKKERDNDTLQDEESEKIAI